MINFKVKLLTQGCLPTKGSKFAAGWDLRAAKNCVVRPDETVLVQCGIMVELPEDCAAFLQPRSGLALRHGITIANTPGLCDSDFRNEYCVLLRNEGSCPFEVKIGDRIAQMVIKRLEPTELEVVEELSETGRGLGGFGSSGIK